MNATVRQACALGVFILLVSAGASSVPSSIGLTQTGVTQTGLSQIDRVQQAQTGGQWFSSDTPGPHRPPLLGSRAQQGLSTLELLITVRLLQRAAQQGTITPDNESRQALIALLRPLVSQKTFNPGFAEQFNQDLLGTLDWAQLTVIEQQRAALERAAQNTLGHARLLTADGPVNLVAARYGLMVPGAQATVKAVLADPRTNPYAQPGANASTLQLLLSQLR